MDPRDNGDLADELPALPALDNEDGDDVFEDRDGWQVSLPEAGDDPFDDSYASDVPLDFELSQVNETGSAVGDDQLGIEDSDGQLLPMGEHSSGSLIDDGAQEPPLFAGDEELGIDPIPREVDDGGLEGLEDAGAETVDLSAFPPLDGHGDDDDEAVDVGLALPTALPALDDGT